MDALVTTRNLTTKLPETLALNKTGKNKIQQHYSQAQTNASYVWPCLALLYQDVRSLAAESVG